jgi:hypothetical protein
MSRKRPMLLPEMIATACFVTACSAKPAADAIPEGRVVFAERFDGALGAFTDTSAGSYSIVGGALRAQGAHNHPLWLNTPLPRNARVDFTARSMSPAVDIKAEIFGDGKAYAHEASYTATSYVVILGGWNNSRSIIARMNEHGRDRKVREEPHGETGRTYAFSVVRTGSRLTWYLDGARFLDFEDREPLAGEGHDRFAFNNWESEVYFDDLAIREL